MAAPPLDCPTDRSVMVFWAPHPMNDIAKDYPIAEEWLHEHGIPWTLHYGRKPHPTYPGLMSVELVFERDVDLIQFKLRFPTYQELV